MLPIEIPEDDWDENDIAFATPLKKLSKAKLVQAVSKLDPELVSPTSGCKRLPNMSIILGRAVAFNRANTSAPDSNSIARSQILSRLRSDSEALADLLQRSHPEKLPHDSKNLDLAMLRKDITPPSPSGGLTDFAFDEFVTNYKSSRQQAADRIKLFADAPAAVSSKCLFPGCPTNPESGESFCEGHLPSSSTQRCANPKCNDQASPPGDLCSLCAAKARWLKDLPPAKQCNDAIGVSIAQPSPPSDPSSAPCQCKQCSKPLQNATARFCSFCSFDQMSAPAPTTCRCGTNDHLPGARACHQCGSPLLSAKKPRTSYHSGEVPSFNSFSHQMNILRDNRDPARDDIDPPTSSGVGNIDPDVENAVRFGLFISLSFFVLRFEDRAARVAKSLKNTFSLASALRTCQFSGQYKAPSSRASVPTPAPISSVHQLLQALQRLREVRAAFFPQVANADRIAYDLVQHYASKRNFNVAHCVECIDEHFETSANQHVPAFPLLPVPHAGFTQADLALMWSAPAVLPTPLKPLGGQGSRGPSTHAQPPAAAAEGKSPTLGHYCFAHQVCFNYNIGTCSFPHCKNEHRCPCGATDHGHSVCKKPMFSPDQIKSSRNKAARQQ